MDFLNLKQNHKKLISHMKEKGYSKNYIHTVQIEIDVSVKGTPHIKMLQGMR